MYTTLTSTLSSYHHQQLLVAKSASVSPACLPYLLPVHTTLYMYKYTDVNVHTTLGMGWVYTMSGGERRGERERETERERACACPSSHQLYYVQQ